MKIRNALTAILLIVHSSLLTLSSPAAVPLRWTVETSRVQPTALEAYQGEALDLAVSLQSYGRPVEIPGDASLFWQTNGMGARWWTAPASVSSNVLSAVWSPTNDVGARVYTCFIGQTGSNYRAEFTLRLRPSPGIAPNHLPLPTVQAEIDPVFSAWLATNTYAAASIDTNAVNDLIVAATMPLLATVDAWQTYWGGDDVRLTVTNYYGNQGTPSLSLEQKMPADETHDTPRFKTVWDELTRWNAFMPRFDDLWNFAHQNLADRAWGVYDSSTGEYSPDGLLQLSQDQIMIASKMSWHKTVTTGGSVWILTATTPFVMSVESTNGFFRITDGDGHAIFEIVKGDKQIVPATPTSCLKYIDGFSVGFPVDSIRFQHPVGEVALDLDGPYVPEDSLDGLSVAWDGESGYWVATVTATPPHAMPKKMFFRATYETGGNTYIRNNVATSIDKVVVGGIEYTVTVETVNGKKLLVLQ